MQGIEPIQSNAVNVGTWYTGGIVPLVHKGPHGRNGVYTVNISGGDPMQ